FMDAAARAEASFHLLKEADASGLLEEDRRVPRPETAEEKVWVGFLYGSDMGTEFGFSQLGPQIQYELHIRVELGEDGFVGVPAVPAVGVIVVDTGNGLDLREVLGRHDSAA